MTPSTIAANPFALMINPEAIFAAIQDSARLARLNSRICRPLDKLRVPRSDDETAAFDEHFEEAASPDAAADAGD